MSAGAGRNARPDHEGSQSKAQGRKGMGQRCSACGSSASLPLCLCAQSEDPQVVERAKDVLRSAIRCLAQMHQVPNVDSCPKFIEFWLRVQKTQLLAELMRELQ